VDFFFRLINGFINRVNQSGMSKLFDLDETNPLSTDNAIVCIYTDDGANYTMAIFNVNQWSMVQDIGEITSQSTEDVVRSLSSDAPNIFNFNRDDFSF